MFVRQPASPALSIIIPCLNEEDFIPTCLSHIYQHGNSEELEVILVDAGSADETLRLAEEFPCKIVHSKQKSRAIQMNLGASRAEGTNLFFLHADALVPPQFDNLIFRSLQSDARFGLFAYDFYPDSRWLRLNAWFTRKRWGFTGGGDQGLFMPRSLFQEMGGYDETLAVMEDFDFFKRLKKRYASWSVIQTPLQVSSRKYQNNSYLKVQLINFLAVLAFRMGASTSRIRCWYERQLTKKADA